MNKQVNLQQKLFRTIKATYMPCSHGKPLFLPGARFAKDLEITL